MWWKMPDVMEEVLRNVIDTNQNGVYERAEAVSVIYKLGHEHDYDAIFDKVTGSTPTNPIDTMTIDQMSRMLGAWARGEYEADQEALIEGIRHGLTELEHRQQDLKR